GCASGRPSCGGASWAVPAHTTSTPARGAVGARPRVETWKRSRTITMTTTSTSTKATPGTGVRLGSPYARWEARLEELAAFVDEHGGLPTQTGRVARDAGAGVA